MYSIFEKIKSLQWYCRVICQKEASFIILLLWLLLAGFSRVNRVRAKIRIQFSLSDRVGTGLPDVK